MAADHQTDVLIIGGGVTGAGVMRDLALRGISSILIDRSDLDSGASGGNHGLLHSGARYAVSDPDTAAECAREGALLKRLAPECVDDCGGMFVAVEGDDPAYARAFPEHCARAGIACEPLTARQARGRERALPDTLIAAYAVPDATIDPFRLTLELVADAMRVAGSTYLGHVAVEGFEIAQGRIHTALCRDRQSGEAVTIRAREVVNAAGAWAAKVAHLAGCDEVRLVYAKGTLIIANTRITRGVINRLRPPGDGDILVPGGTVSILGTSSVAVADPDDFAPSVGEVDRVLDEGTAMVPVLARTRFLRAYAGVRPLLATGTDTQGGRGAGRGFALFDHAERGVGNFTTITGGKLTTFRLMAQKTADLVAARLGNSRPCRTDSEPLPSGEGVRWSAPGAAARDWLARADPDDTVLCECEMVARSVVDEIIRSAPGAGQPGHAQQMSLRAIAARSRIGKGACQGAFCAMRVTSHLYESGIHRSPDGLAQMRDFITERYRGVRPVLWGAQLPSFELAEILHCALGGLDLEDDGAP